MKKKIILASSSPRRRDILEKMGLEFEIIPSDYEEIFENFDFTYEKIEELAYNKAISVLDKLKNHSPFTIHHSLILGADTVVVLNEKIMGKPKNETEAMEMLRLLSGNRHSVVTSICVIDSTNYQKKILSTTSFVQFNVLSEDLIKSYISDYKPFDKAGSYGIQELPEGFIAGVAGSFENIIGLCSDAVEKVLKAF
jgi:septum formation protein